MKNNKHFLDVIQKLESLIETYDLKQATELINSLPLDDFPDALRPKFASLAKRLSLPQLGLKILWSQIYDQPRPKPEFMEEFASCLRKQGLCYQARLWLNRLPTSDTVLKELAFVHIHLWEYTKARDILSDLLSRSTPSQPSQFSVLKTNLASCHVFLGEVDEALKHISDLEKNKGYGNQQIYLNSIEMHAQCLMQNGQPADAYAQLEKVLSATENEVSLTHLFLKKWQLLARIAENPSFDFMPEFRELQTLSRKLRHWETLRDIDYQIALLKNNMELMTKVYFGTPYDTYKQRILSKVSANHLPNIFIWQSHDTGEQTRVLDTFLELGSKLGIGQTEHRLFMLLLSDQYRPFSASKIFDQLYQNELYDPFSSENRVHTLVKVLRKHLAEHEIPLELFSTVAGYRLRPNDKMAFRIYPKMSFSSINDFYSTVIGYAFGKKSFSRFDLESILHLSTAQGHRRIKELVDAGVLIKHGKGPSTSYTVSQQSI